MTKMDQLVKVLPQILPAMQADGGGLDLVGEEDGKVFVRLKGTCLFCPSANLTIKHGVEKTFKQALPWVQEVVNVSESMLRPAMCSV